MTNLIQQLYQQMSNPLLWSTGGHIFLYDVLQGIIPEELSKGAVLIEQFLVGAHL